jgi:hypothetical protein
MLHSSLYIYSLTWSPVIWLYLSQLIRIDILKTIFKSNRVLSSRMYVDVFEVAPFRDVVMFHNKNVACIFYSLTLCPMPHASH